jgi:hypothetical protein
MLRCSVNDGIAATVARSVRVTSCEVHGEVTQGCLLPRLALLIQQSAIAPYQADPKPRCWGPPLGGCSVQRVPVRG